MSSTSPYFALITFDFNVKSTNESIHDTTTSETAQEDSLMTPCGLKQLITQPSHFRNRLFLFRFDFHQLTISCSGINILHYTGIHSTLHSQCHHQMV